MKTPEVLALAALEGEKQRRLIENKLAYFQPYPKQREFLAAGAKFRERLLLAANQVGKTYAGAMEVAIHATGRVRVVDRLSFRSSGPRVGLW
ncbi:MAG: hypothetical protein WA625_00440 [Pseudolabrys sp.]|jgi:hypothetical protein